jgi:hypothetical protein
MKKIFSKIEYFEVFFNEENADIQNFGSLDKDYQYKYIFTIKRETHRSKKDSFKIADFKIIK